MAYNNLNDNYTMIVPTYNRLPYLTRLLAYLAVSDVKFQIIILDSSDDNIKDQIKRIISLSPLKIRHERYSPEEDVNEKIMDGMKMVETEYLSLCADDDLVILSTLSTLIDFLRKNSGYLCAHGLYFSFQQMDEGYVNLEEVTYATPSLEQDHPLARLTEYVRRYQPIFYSVHRTEWWRKTFSKTCSLQSYLFEEAAPACLTAIAGKVARLYLFYYGQNRETDVAEPDNPKIITNHPARWYKHNRRGMLRAFVHYRSMLLDALKQTSCSGMEERAVTNIVNQIHGGYLAESLRHCCYENVDRELALLTEDEIDETLFITNVQATVCADEQTRVTFRIGEPLMEYLRPRFSMASAIPPKAVRKAMHEMAPYWVANANNKT